jgi:FkbM family methyltransferase
MAGVTHRLREFFEYNLKPTWDLLSQRKFGFLIGAVVEELTNQNPYFWYREYRNESQIVTQQVRDHKMQIDLYDRGISRHLFIRGVHEENATNAYRAALNELQDKIDKGVTVLDIGANIGYYVLEEASVLGDQATIIAFEPDPSNRELLKKNIELNGYISQVDISSKAVDEDSGERTFCRSTHSNWNRLEQDNESRNVDEFVERFSVKTTSVDEFLEGEDISSEAVNSIRMDLEGHEIKVLQGMEDVLSANEPLVLFVEFHPNFGERDRYEAAISILDAYGFSVRFVDQNWNVLDIDSFEGLKSIDGSHVRVIMEK